MNLPHLTRTQAETPALGIVHFGPGAFFRAFEAIYTDDVLKAEGGDWGIMAVSLRSPDIRDKMVTQNFAYTSATLSPEGKIYRVINSVIEVAVAPENPKRILEAMAEEGVKIISLTITEKGYCYHPSSGALRLEDPDIQHDLAHLDRPKTAIGFLVSALIKRKEKGVPPFSILSCDNLPDNGALTKRIVTEFARRLDPELAEWIAQEVAFPITMVDRITPATTEADIAELGHSEGYFDPGLVVHEPFRQWVIEDKFSTPRPNWNLAGAQFVQDVAPFEFMKLRCLNGTHSTLAYLGYLAGFETIADTMREPGFVKLLETMWEKEIIPTVPKPEGEDLNAYAKALLKRYQNPNIRHRTWQIAMDGSQKLPQRILGTVRDNIAAKREFRGLALAVAAWMRYVGGRDEAGAEIDVRDPLAERLRDAAYHGGSPAETVRALLGFDEIFGKDLAADDSFITSVTKAYEALLQNGALACVKAYSA